MKIYTYLFAFCLILLTSCGGNNVKNLELKQFDDIKVTEFKKKNVTIETKMRYYNPNDFSVMITMIDFDISVNGKDISSFIVKDVREVKAGALVEIPVKVDFEPEIAFDDFEAGLVKIKSDHVAQVKMEGYLTIKAVEKEQTIEYDMNQNVLFTNKNDINIDEEGNIINQ